MASDGGAEGRMQGRKRMDSGFHWVSSSPSSVKIASLEATFPDVVRVPVAELEAEMGGWQSRAILVRTYQKWVPASALIRELRRAGIQGEILPISLAFRCHILRFEDPNACDVVLNRPWVVNGQVVGTERWRPEFIPAEDAIPSALIWVRLPNLPMKFWKEDFLRVILNSVGQFFCADPATMAKSRGGFARACIRIDLRQPLRPGTRIQGINLPFWQQFAFENLEGICSSCGKLHIDGPCSQADDSVHEGVAAGSFYGPWIAAVRQRRAVSDPQRDVRRKSQSMSSQEASGIGAGSQSMPSELGSGGGVSEGWSSPVKVARRRVPAAMKVVVNPSKDKGCAEDDLVQGNGEKGDVPVFSQRAGLKPSVKKVVQSMQVGSSEKSLNSMINPNPFASLGLLSGEGGLQDKRDAYPGPLKRARPVDCQAPRSNPKIEKRKGKGKAPMSKSVGVSIFSSDSLSLPPLCREGGQEVVMSRPERTGDSNVEIIMSKNKGLSPGSPSSAQSPRTSIISEGLQAGLSMVTDGGTLGIGCLSDSVMLEDQGEVPASSNCK